MPNKLMQCTGCGTKRNLSISHIIPRSRRKDLIDVEENKTWHCLSVGEKVGCHQKHESMRIVELNDFEKSMLYMKQFDRQYFYLRFFKLIEHYKNDERIVARIKALDSEG